jgi:hypothetical protein
LANVSIKNDADGFYIDASAMEAVLASENVHVVSMASFQYPEGLQRRPTRQEDPTRAKFYFVNQDIIPWDVVVHFALSGPTKEHCDSSTHLSVRDHKLNLGVALWSRPNDIKRLIWDVEREGDPLKEMKTKVLAILHRKAGNTSFTEDAISLFIGPRDTAVPLTRPTDIFLITDGDTILVKTPLDDLPVPLPARLPAISRKQPSVDKAATTSSAKAGVHRAEHRKAAPVNKNGKPSKSQNGAAPDTRDGNRTINLTPNAEKLLSLAHPNICRLIGTIDPSGAALVTEYADRRSLYDQIHKSNWRPTTALKLKVAADIAAALQYMHSHRLKYVHGSLTSHGVVLTEEYQAKLRDGGLAGIPGGREHSRRTHPQWTGMFDHGTSLTKDSIFKW